MRLQLGLCCIAFATLACPFAGPEWPPEDPCLEGYGRSVIRGAPEEIAAEAARLERVPSGDEVHLCAIGLAETIEFTNLEEISGELRIIGDEATLAELRFPRLERVRLLAAYSGQGILDLPLVASSSRTVIAGGRWDIRLSTTATIGGLHSTSDIAAPRLRSVTDGLSIGPDQRSSFLELEFAEGLRISRRTTPLPDDVFPRLRQIESLRVESNPGMDNLPLPALDAVKSVLFRDNPLLNPCELREWLRGLPDAPRSIIFEFNGACR